MIVVIPAYNPDERLLALQAELRARYDPLIIVVDDGSGAEAAWVFDELRRDPRCDVLVHDHNRGKGAALKTAARHVAAAHPGEGFVTADADGQHRAADIFRVGQALLRSPGALILGARDFSSHPGNGAGQSHPPGGINTDNNARVNSAGDSGEAAGKIPWRSRWGNRLTALVFLLCAGRRLRDTQTGLRGIPATFIPAFTQIPGDGFEFETNVLLETARHTPLEEVPIATVYLDDNASSHFHPLRDTLRVAACFARFGLSSAACALIDLGVFTAMTTTLASLGLALAPARRILTATVTARVLSGLCNFLINRHFVFAPPRRPTPAPLPAAAAAHGPPATLPGGTTAVPVTIAALRGETTADAAITAPLPGGTTASAFASTSAASATSAADRLTTPVPVTAATLPGSAPAGAAVTATLPATPAPLPGAAAGYGALFCAQLLASWLLVTALSATGLPVVLTKALVDSALFFASFSIQRRCIFRPAAPAASPVAPWNPAPGLTAAAPGRTAESPVVTVSGAVCVCGRGR